MVRNSNRYHNYRITLCGNILWKDIAETFDKEFVDSFIWIEREKFLKDIFYKHKLLKEINTRGFATVVDTTYSREILFGDTIVRASDASERIGSEGSLDSYVKWKRKLFSDNYYTKLLPASSKNLFEFYRNKEFFEIMLGSKLDIKKTSIDISKISADYNRYEDFALIFPGASETEKTWEVKNFIEVAAFLKSKNSLKIVVAGSNNEVVIGQTIASALGKETFDLTGKTSLSQLAKLISLAKILISNDTSAVHFAAAVDTPFICVSNGNRFGRFHPYPSEVFDKGHYIYPTEIMNQIENPELLSQRYRFKTNLDINSISPEKVKNLLQKMLK